MVIRDFCKHVNIRTQPPGRAKQSLLGTLAVARNEPDESLIEICEHGLVWIDQYIALRARRRLQRVARSDGEARRLDRAVDNFLGDIHRALERAPGRYPHHPERHEWAATLQGTYFPDGVLPIINLPYEEELIIAEYIHHHLTTEHADWCRALRIDGLLEDLGEVLPAYREALTPDDPISADDLTEAFDHMQHALCAAVAYVLGHYWRPEQGEVRTRLLRAIRDQDQRIADVLAARRKGGSGALDVPLDEPGDGALPDAGVDLDDVDIDLDAPEAAPPEAAPPEAAPPEADGADGDPRPLRPLRPSSEG